MTSRTLLAAALLGVAALAAPREARAQATRQVTCQSQNGRFNFCQVPDGTGGRVRLARNLSDTRCVLNRTWGFDYRGVWVDQGCRGVFEVAGSGGGGWESGEGGRVVACASRGNEYHLCRVATHGDVRLVRQLSDRPCIARQTWGFQADGIWVTSGCRAEFEVGYSDASWEDGERQVTCESDDNRYRRCRTWTYGEVRLVRQLSQSRCTLNRSWGYDRDGIWVTNGCRGVFAVGTEQGGGGWGEFPGGGNNGGSWGGSWAEIEQQGRAACTNLARQRGFIGLAVLDTDRRPPADLAVGMRGRLGSGLYNVSCLYDSSRRRADILGQTLVGGGDGNGDGSVEARARDACGREAASMGYSGFRATGVRRQANQLFITAEARNAGRPYELTCRYTVPSRRALIIEQSQIGPRPR